jgi:hypothetical protein
VTCCAPISGRRRIDPDTICIFSYPDLQKGRMNLDQMPSVSA